MQPLLAKNTCEEKPGFVATGCRYQWAQMEIVWFQCLYFSKNDMNAFFLFKILQTISSLISNTRQAATGTIIIWHRIVFECTYYRVFYISFICNIFSHNASWSTEQHADSSECACKCGDSANISTGIVLRLFFQ